MSLLRRGPEAEVQEEKRGAAHVIGATNSLIPKSNVGFVVAVVKANPVIVLIYDTPASDTHTTEEELDWWFRHASGVKAGASPLTRRWRSHRSHDCADGRAGR